MFVCVGVWGPWGRESIARSALLSGYLGKSGHLPRCTSNVKIQRGVASYSYFRTYVCISVCNCIADANGDLGLIKLDCHL